MRDVEAFEPQHALATPRELPTGGASHAADTDHDDIERHWETSLRRDLT